MPKATAYLKAKNKPYPLHASSLNELLSTAPALGMLWRFGNAGYYTQSRLEGGPEVAASLCPIRDPAARATAMDINVGSVDSWLCSLKT